MLPPLQWYGGWGRGGDGSRDDYCTPTHRLARTHAQRQASSDLRTTATRKVTDTDTGMDTDMDADRGRNTSADTIGTPTGTPPERSHTGTQAGRPQGPRPGHRPRHRQDTCWDTTQRPGHKPGHNGRNTKATAGTPPGNQPARKTQTRHTTSRLCGSRKDSPPNLRRRTRLEASPATPANCKCDHGGCSGSTPQLNSGTTSAHRPACL